MDPRLTKATAFQRRVWAGTTVASPVAASGKVESEGQRRELELELEPYLQAWVDRATD